MIKVVMAFILDSRGMILIAKRATDKKFGGLWEFPGGKMEINESPAEAIIREIREELGVTVETIHEYSPYSYNTSETPIEFFPIQCCVHEGTPVSLEHEEICMTSIKEISRFHFAPPDYQAIELLLDDYENLRRRSQRASRGS